MSHRLLLRVLPVADAVPRFEAPTGDPAGPDFGRWTGRTLRDVGAAEPEAIRAWLTDPFVAPHGGESLAELIIRLGRWLDGVDSPSRGLEVEVSALVARGLVVHALGAPPATIFRIDVAPGGRVVLSRSGSFWRLQELSRPGRRSDSTFPSPEA